MSAPLIAPGAVWRPVPSHSDVMRDEHLGLVLHVTTNHFSPFGFFSDPSNRASSTWWVSDDGVLEQYVDARLRAWAQADGNGEYQSVETSGTAGDLLTPAQLDTLTGLYSWGHAELGWQLALAEKPGEPGFGWHGMGGTAWGGHFGCPGVRKTQRSVVLDRVRQTTTAGELDVDEATLRKIIRSEVADQVRTLIVGDHDAAGTPAPGGGTHPANLTSIRADLAALRQKLQA